MYKYKDSIPKEEFEGLIPLTVSLSENIWGKPVDIRINAIKEFLEKASEIEDMNVPSFVYEPSKEAYKLTLGGRYIPVINQITLYHKFSLLTLLHEFRHAMQYNAGCKLYDADLEEDARRWSCCLFAYALPEKYVAACNKGTIRFEQRVADSVNDDTGEILY